MTNEQFTIDPSSPVAQASQELLRYTADGRVFCRWPDGRFVEVIEKLPAEPSPVHTRRQNEDGWVWHQGCGCPYCVHETARIAAEQQAALNRTGES